MFRENERRIGSRVTPLLAVGAWVNNKPRGSRHNADVETKMPGRMIAIGDIHGCSMALDALLQAVGPRQDDTIVCLGDYVDRGLDSKGVIDRLVALTDRCRVVPILGNHDEKRQRRLPVLGGVRWHRCVGELWLIRASRLDSAITFSLSGALPAALGDGDALFHPRQLQAWFAARKTR